MTIESIIIRDNSGEEKLGAEALPLRFGTAADCNIRVPGPGATVVALLDVLDGQPFVQPVGSAEALSLNGEPLAASRRLADGDVLEYFGSKLVIAIDGATVTFAVRLEGSAYVTRPPELPATEATPDEEAIVATAFRRSEETAAKAIEPQGTRWQTIVGGVIAVLLLGSWFIFSSKSIQFDVQPAGADDIAISGGWFTLPVGDRILVRSGTYTVHVQKAGYYDVSQSIDVGDQPSETFVVEMRKLPGQLTVRTDPPVDALVTVDGSRVGNAPYGPIELEPGTHSVSVRADRFLPFAYNVEVPGLGMAQMLEVQLVPLWADVAVSSSPAGAAIYQGTEQIGETPATLELMEGSHSLTLIKDGFAARDISIDALADVDQIVPTINLEPANAQLRVNSIPRAANVTVNGRYRGQSPVTIALSPGIDYTIGLSKAGYGSTERRIRLAAAASEEMTVDMTARTGELTVRVLPGDATIYIDGQARGSGTATMKLTALPHELEVRRNGYVTQKRTVTPRPGYPQEIAIRLLSEAELAAQSIASSTATSQGQELRRVEPGTFQMGSSRSEQGRQANEVIVPVTVSKPFFISAKEVTNREFRRFRANHDSGSAIHVALAGDHNPVANVSWSDAVEYLNWLSAQEGLTPAYEKVFERWQPITPTPNGYRLPTEAEWVWAVRYQGRPSAQTFPWGRSLPPRTDSGNWAGRSANALVPSILPGWDDGYASTAPVGSFRANALGIFDGGGNVAEWVQDFYAVPTAGLTEPVMDPQGPRRGRNRVIRGSSWRHAGIRELRLAYREFGLEGRPDVGFRIARNVE